MSVESSKKAEPLRKIGEVSDLLGVTVRALRFYEEEGLIAACRTPRGTRLYSEEDIARFKGIIRLAESGIPLSLIKNLIAIRSGHRTGAESSRHVGQVLDQLISRVKSQVMALSGLVSDLSDATETLKHCFTCRNAPTRKGCPQCPINQLTRSNELLNLIWEQHSCAEQSPEGEATSPATGDA